MEVRAGYKQTEVGVIPEDWTLTPISEHFEFKNGLNKAKQFFGTGKPIVNYMDVYSKIGLEAGDIHGTVSLSSEERQRYEIKKGDVFFTRTSETLDEIGLTSVLLDDIDEAVFSGFVLRARPTTDSFSLNFKKYCFCTRMVRDQITSSGTYTTRALTNGRHLSKVKVPLPPTKAEQEAIAGALSDADGLIESLEQLIAKKRAIKQGTMQELLTGKKRLPGFSGEWEETSLESVGVFFKGSGIRKHEANSGVLACVRYGEIYTRHDDYVKSYYSNISAEVATTARRLRQGDLLFAGSGETREEIGKCVAFLDGMEAYAGGDIVILRPQNVDSLFLGYYLNTPTINDQKARKGQGDAVVHISASALAEIDIRIPLHAEQTAIATILSDMDTEITALKAKLTKAKQIKQGMMQELLTGKIRLV
ncbi:MAG: restriction endonuclease subunit S [Desulfobulbaceae bacterium]|nr:restriction endonuclease subunit S [Desulfobulbaceae bacterium]